MTEYSNEMKFVLFPNSSDNSRAPQYKGNVTLNGVKYALSGWLRDIRTGDNQGRQLISGEVEEWREKTERRAEAPRGVQAEPIVRDSAGGVPADDDNLPF